MDEKNPWTGGISNRQIFLDTARAVTVWVAISISLGLALWWLTNGVHFPNPNLRVSVCCALSVVLGGPIARWCRA